MIINVPFEKLRNVVHIADIHVRLLRRHDEYEAAFERLYSDIRAKNLEDFVIVLAGDIVHAKTDLSPELVDITSKFLSNLADIAPTILILGNHDLNLANKNRLDSLSPIVNNLQHPNLHFARDTSIVKVADTEFAVFSVLDKQENWPTADACTAPNKVALFHGPIDGANTDANYTITSRHFHIDNFYGYDIAMLGDIHRHQVLQEYNPTLGKPIITYAGSLLQQNHGEQLTGHGWCLWDIPSRTYEFVPLQNDYGYCTIEVVGDQIHMPNQFPNKVRMRLFTGDLDAVQVQKLVASLRNKYDIVELSVNKNRFAKRLVGSNIAHETLDLTSVTTQNELITDWLKRNFPNNSQSVTNTIIELNKELNDRIHHEDYSRNINWKPLKFTFSNMFSYGEGNEINFADMDGVYGLFATNGSGKSAAVEALMFCLYDKTPRAFKGDHIMNNRKDEFECQLIFEINDETYGIKRVGSRKKTGVVKVDVEFWKKGNDGEIISLNGEDRRNTNANIRNYVGTYEDFIMTTLSSQSANSIFIDKSNSERKDLLMQFMGLNIFDKLYDIANDESKEIAGVLKRFKKMDVTEELVTINDDLKNARQELEEVEGQYEEIKTIKVEYDKKIETLLSNKRIVPPSSQSVDILENELSRAQELLAENTNKLEKANTDFDNLTQMLQSLESDYAKYDTQSLLASVEQHRTTNSEVENLTQLVKVASTKLTEKNKFKEKLSGYKYNPNCDVCVENNKNIIDDLEAANKDIEDLTTYISVKNDLKEAALISLQALEEDVATYNLTLKFKEDIDSLKNIRLPRLTNDIQSITLKIDNTKKNIGNIEENINIYHQNKEAILHNQQIDNEIKEIQIVINTEENKLNTAQKIIRDLHGNVSVLEAKQQDLRAKLVEAERLEETYEAYNQYALAIGRDGIPYEIVKKITPNIETEVNNILSQIVDFNIMLEVEGKNINGKLVYDYDRSWPLENSSGMERFISSLAIRVALMNVSNLPKPNFLIIDEGFGVLDAEHLSSMQTLFNLLKTHFDFILIVSHLDTARDMVDNIIEIHKEDGYSHISA